MSCTSQNVIEGFPLSQSGQSRRHGHVERIVKHHGHVEPERRAPR